LQQLFESRGRYGKLSADPEDRCGIKKGCAALSSPKESATCYIDPRTGVSLSRELDPETASVVDALLECGSDATRLTLTNGRWLDESGKEWVLVDTCWHPRRRAA
jgi:hypothetical protein